MCLILIYSIFAAWTECVKSSSVSTPTKKDPTDNNQRKRITEKQENKYISDILYIRYKYTKNMINSQNIAKALSGHVQTVAHAYDNIIYM